MDAMMQACQKAIGCMLFEGVEQAQTLHLLQTYAQLQTFEKGQIIYSPGHYQHSLGIIVRGRTVVEKECGVLLNDLGAGQCFGAAALFVPQDQYVTTVRAKTGCSILFLSMEQMRQILLQNPVIAFNYIRFLSGRIQFLNRKIDSFTAPGAQQALLSYLRQQPGGSWRVSIRTAHGVDACAIARRMGGGGHLRAAGCELLGTLDNVKQAVLAEAGAVLDAAGEES